MDMISDLLLFMFEHICAEKLLLYSKIFTLIPEQIECQWTQFHEKSIICNIYICINITCVI